jgi:hypothetical protein
MVVVIAICFFLVSLPPSHCLAHHLFVHHLVPFLQLKKMELLRWTLSFVFEEKKPHVLDSQKMDFLLLLLFSRSSFFGLVSLQDQKMNSLFFGILL